MDKAQLISEMLLLPSTAIEYHVSQHLLQFFPDKALIESESFLDIKSFSEAQHCTLSKQTFTYNQMNTYWHGPEPQVLHPHLRMMPMGMSRMLINNIQPFPGMPGSTTSKAASETEDMVNKAWFEVKWEEHKLDVLMLNIQGENSHKSHCWLLAETEQIARDFFAAVSRWNAEIRGEVLVFDNGTWYKDEHLFQDIQNATFDNLILRGSLKQEILEDLVEFFASQAIYEEHDVPWKRGILFVGPAGNGKTHTVKALINTLQQPCLYVKSFRALHSQGADEFNIRQVFARARRSAPCVLVLEDLDSLLTSQNRSFFLNELDGFASNIGIVTLATTNHPERLDPSILDRPSRFDRKYPFDLPEKTERDAYILLWNESLKPDLRLSNEGTTKISELTDGFSFAYLKELFLSSKMRWIAHPQQGTMEQVMIEQVGKLREQMLSTNISSTPEMPEEFQGMPPMFGGTIARSIRFPRGL